MKTSLVLLNRGRQNVIIDMTIEIYLPFPMCRRVFSMVELRLTFES